jgi:hypothetical protein
MKQIRTECKNTLQKEQVTVRELAHVVGVLAATQLAVYQHLYIIVHYRPRKTKVFSTPTHTSRQ